MDKNKYRVDENIIKNNVKKQKKNKFLVFIFFIVIIALMIIGISLNIIDTNKKIEQAETYLNKKECDNALEIYKKMNQDEKYKSKIYQCKYDNALDYYNNSEYDKAYPIFFELNDYEDAYKYYLESYYNYAKVLETKGEYYETINMLYEILGYEDSKDIYNDLKMKLIENAQVGDIVFLGEYEQDGDEENGKEPIEWFVLSRNDDNLLIISKYILKKMRFGASYYWKSSEVREWLNSDFYETSFNETERNIIQSVITSTETNDNIFCLSSEEARLLFSSDSDRIAYPTQILIDAGFKVWSSKGSGEWWTRSVSTASNGKGVVPVEADGNVRSAGTNHLALEEYTYTDIGVRPSVSINIKSTSPVAINMSIYGHDSNVGLDNEPYIPPITSSSSSSDKKRRVITNYSGCYPAKPHYVCYEYERKDGSTYERCRCYPNY